MSLILYNTVYAEPGYVVPSWGGATDEELAVALQKHYAGEIDLNEHWNIGDERTVELTTGETIQMVLMHRGQYPIVGEKVDTPVGNLPIGSVIQLNENGSPVDYMVVHQGNPDPEMYDESCDGTWVLRKDSLEDRGWTDLGNSYGSSKIHSDLNGAFLNQFDNDTKNVIKQVKIPYVNYSGSVASGASGLSCKIFLLSGYEVGFSINDDPGFPHDGAKLLYFSSGTNYSAARMRIAYYNGKSTDWWLRSPSTGSPQRIWSVSLGGYDQSLMYDATSGARPAFILDSTFTVKAYPTCAFVVGMKDCLDIPRVMNSSATNAGGWNGCEMRTQLNSTVYNQIPESFRQIFRKMNIWTANGGSQSGTVGVYSQEYLALPAEREIFGNNDHGDPSIESRLFQFEWYKTAANRVKRRIGSKAYWWERTSSDNDTEDFCDVDVVGDSSSGAVADTTRATSFFCAI